MPNTTDQHSWYYPVDGDRDYEDTFETFFEQLDNDVEIRDTDTNKNNYDPKVGAKYVATDTEDVYIGDGDSWNHLVSTGKDPTFESVSTDKLNISEPSGQTDVASISPQGRIISNGEFSLADDASEIISESHFNRQATLLFVVNKSDNSFPRPLITLPKCRGKVGKPQILTAKIVCLSMQILNLSSRTEQVLTSPTAPLRSTSTVACEAD